MKKRIKPTGLNNDRGRGKHILIIPGQCASPCNSPRWNDPKPNRTPINKDNSIWGYNGVGVPCGWTARVPSIKKSKRVWENFYRLYPSILEIVDQHKDRAINGIVTITERFGCNCRTEKYEPMWIKRTMKFRIL